MTDVIVFHHAQGLTDGVRQFADQLRSAGHRVTVPDLYEGKTFGALADGIAHAGQIGFDTIIERGRAAAEGLPNEIVYAGASPCAGFCYTCWRKPPVTPGTPTCSARPSTAPSANSGKGIMGMQVIEGAGRYTPAAGEPTHWAEHLASADLSVGTYSIPAGGLDDQAPHREDEIYVVQAGAATLVTDSGAAQVQAGSVIFVPAGERHRFTDVRESLALLVIFAPPYGSRSDVENAAAATSSS